VLADAKCQQMEHTPLPKLLRVPAVAEALDITNARARELVRTGVLPCVRIGRQVRVEENTVKNFIATGGRALPGGWKRQAEPNQVA
jgi:excisionase family DNA binding protein